MITLSDTYNVLTNVVPLYVALILGYISIKWLKMFNQDQCSGISKFVSKFAIPLLSFRYIAENNPYTMNYRFIAADTLQKLIVLLVLLAWYKFSSKGSLQWCITLFSVSTLPSILVMGVPMLDVMYGHASDTLLVQTVVLQYLIWFSLLLFLLEYRAATVLVSEKLPDTARTVSSVEVDPGIVSLDGDKELLETRTEDVKDGKVHVKVIRKVTGSGINCDVMSGVQANGCSESLSVVDKGSVGKDGRVFVRSFSAPASSGMPAVEDYDDCGREENRVSGTNGEDLTSSKLNSTSITEPQAQTAAVCKSAPSATVMTRLILMMVWRKLIRNPNAHASIIGLAWSLISFRWNVKMPSIVSGSTKIFSDCALGSAMFSLGCFMAMQPKFIACGKTAAAFAAAAKFIIGPVVMAATSIISGLRGNLLHIAILQAALPLGIVTFVFAKEYDVHPDIQSTGIMFGMLIALPVTFGYYVLMGL